MLQLVAAAQGTHSQLEFEVASVKLTPLEVVRQSPSTTQAHPGSLTMRSVRLRTCIDWAYSLKEYQVLGPDWLGAPGWLGIDVARYDILAKAAADTPVSDLRLMLRALLMDRFKLAFHMETRQVPAYGLTVPKLSPMLRASDDQTRSGSMTAKDSVVSVQSTTMTEFADWLSGPLHAPVLDMTNLGGRFDFQWDVSRYASGNEHEELNVPSFYMNIVQDALGMKLDRRRTSLEVMVIDRLEKRPTEN
jgi:uncharacterized protein (TIGR03435 family)